MASEIVKVRYHAGLRPALHHFRESRGLEVDAVLERGDRLVLVEMKSGETVRSEFLKGLSRLSELIAASGEHLPVDQVLIHGGEISQRRSGARVLPWSRIVEGPWV